MSLGDCVILYSDGLIEAHNPNGDMFGTHRPRALLAKYQCGEDKVESLLGALDGFTGPNWKQEDDVTLLLLERAATSPERPGIRYVETQTNKSVDGGDCTARKN
jgi:serine phosphatase RsbU (regulator of sigma subunit)